MLGRTAADQFWYKAKRNADKKLKEIMNAYDLANEEEKETFRQFLREAINDTKQSKG